MSQATYENRQELHMRKWPELWNAFRNLNDTIKSSDELPAMLKTEIFTVASVAGGCRHCQSHGAHGLHRQGVEHARIQDLWNYERSELFTDAERAAFELARASAQSPNAAGPEHFAELRKHYSDRQIVDILAEICRAAWLNRWHDTVATVTDQESVDWARENLQTVGWAAGKHKGQAHEQSAPPPAPVVSTLSG